MACSAMANHCGEREGRSRMCCSLIKIGLSIGRRIVLSVSDPCSLALAMLRSHVPTLDLLGTATKTLEGNTRVASEDEVALSVRAETNLEQRLNALGHNLALGYSEHAQDDDRALTLGLGDLLVCTCC